MQRANAKPQHIMVLLGGGRIAPNVAGVVSLRPDALRYLISKDQPHTYYAMRAVFDRMPWLIADAPAVALDAHDMPQIKQAVLDLLAKDPDANFTFNVTCSTKTMAVAVYEVAKVLDQRVIYIDSFTNRVIDWTASTAQERLLSTDLPTFLANFGREPQTTFDFARLLISKEQAIQCATLLAHAGPTADRLLRKMRSRGQKDDKALPADLPRDELDLLQMLFAQGVIVNLRQSKNGGWLYTIPENMHWNFIKGDWMEVYVYSQANTLVTKQGKQFFDDTALSLKMPTTDDSGALREIDFAGLYGWQLIWASCKIEDKPFVKRHLDEISAVNTMIGAHYSTPLYICNGSNAAEEYASFAEHAHKAAIVVVTLEEWPNLANILKAQSIDPTYRRV